MKVERVRDADRVRDVERQLDGGVRRKRVEAPLGKQRLRGLVAAQDLEEHRDSRGVELGSVDSEVGLDRVNSVNIIRRGHNNCERTKLKSMLRLRA